jgi:predicted alpha/beta hydrolase family esterase
MILRIYQRNQNLENLEFTLNKMNIIIVHGRADNNKDNPNSHWIPWIKNELEKRKINVVVVLMPKPWILDYTLWKNEFEKYNLDNKTILIGHSAGCAFLVRYLGDSKNKINKLILVAPWKIPEKEDEKKFYNYKVNDLVKKNIDKIVTFTSNNEEEKGKKSLDIFYNKLGGEIISLKNHGHFTLGDMGTEKFPELLNKILE